LAQYFFDTSAAVKYYHAEAGTAAVSVIFQEPERKIRISSLGFLEIQSAFAMKVRSGALGREAAGMQRARFVLDIAAGDIEVCNVTEDHFASAERLIGRHSFSRRLRTLDALLRLCPK
jgi:PIN domain